MGVLWHVFSDELQISLTSLQKLQLNTCKSKRIVLQAIARIYDPLGMVSPTVIKLKILFQSIWKRKLNWDETIPFDLLGEWNDTIRGVLQLSDMTIPRSALPMLGTSTKYVHIFADASLKAYGAVAYIKSVNAQGAVNVAFLCSKSRVAPLKENNEGELTLPKLELTANLIAARLCNYLKNNLKEMIQRFLLWSDSKIALNWIYGVNKQWKPYIQSRVTEIRSLTSINDWDHCIGKENPADLLTRGISGSKLQESLIWLRGPEWLEQFQDDTTQLNHFEDSDVRCQTALLTEGVLEVSKPHDSVLNCDDFSTWGRLLRITAWVQRFVVVCHKKTKPSSIGLTAEELDSAENYWVRYIQNKAFFNEIRFLQKGQPIKGHSSIAELSPFLDDFGFLRLGGRLQLLEDSFDLKHPKILPYDSQVTRLIIKDYHLRTLHGGVGTVLTKLREKFWVLRGRQLVKKLGKSCTTCKKLFGPPASQPFAPLPKERITLTRPFDNVGIDFAGPLYYTTSYTEVLQKSYLMIVTCAAVRAVHLELLPNMTTEGCLMGLRRFVARRGIPSCILSDNAKTFRRAALELNEVGNLVDDEAVQGFLSQKRIKWKFIVERAPWWGGFWERLIRTVKNTLKVVIGKSNLNFEQLRTFLAEAEAIVNDRPITYVSNDPLDLNPISPSKFLLNTYTASEKENVASTTNEDIRELWKNRFKFTNKMWKRWRVEYLQTLKLFHTNNMKSSVEFREGDVVLLFDNARPRVHWKLAKIEKVFPGRDGRIRSCEIRCGDAKVFGRPIQLLFPLEIGAAEGVENSV